MLAKSNGHIRDDFTSSGDNLLGRHFTLDYSSDSTKRTISAKESSYFQDPLHGHGVRFDELRASPLFHVKGIMPKRNDRLPPDTQRNQTDALRKEDLTSPWKSVQVPGKEAIFQPKLLTSQSYLGSSQNHVNAEFYDATDLGKLASFSTVKSSWMSSKPPQHLALDAFISEPKYMPSHVNSEMREEFTVSESGEFYDQHISNCKVVNRTRSYTSGLRSFGISESIHYDTSSSDRSSITHTHRHCDQMKVNQGGFAIQRHETRSATAAEPIKPIYFDDIDYRGENRRRDLLTQNQALRQINIRDAHLDKTFLSLPDVNRACFENIQCNHKECRFYYRLKAIQEHGMDIRNAVDSPIYDSQTSSPKSGLIEEKATVDRRKGDIAPGLDSRADQHIKLVKRVPPIPTKLVGEMLDENVSTKNSLDINISSRPTLRPGLSKMAEMEISSSDMNPNGQTKRELNSKNKFFAKRSFPSFDDYILHELSDSLSSDLLKSTSSNVPSDSTTQSDGTLSDALKPNPSVNLRRQPSIRKEAILLSAADFNNTTCHNDTLTEVQKLTYDTSQSNCLLMSRQSSNEKSIQSNTSNHKPSSTREVYEYEA